jgi:hypothetical protein
MPTTPHSPAESAALPAPAEPAPETVASPRRDPSDWLRPLAILLAAIAAAMLILEWENLFGEKVPVAPMPQNIHLGPENRALFGEP